MTFLRASFPGIVIMHLGITLCSAKCFLSSQLCFDKFYKLSFHIPEDIWKITRGSALVIIQAVTESHLVLTLDLRPRSVGIKVYSLVLYLINCPDC